VIARKEVASFWFQVIQSYHAVRHSSMPEGHLEVKYRVPPCQALCARQPCGRYRKRAEGRAKQ